MTASHSVDLLNLGSAGWVARCACGWMSTIGPVRREALAAASGHAPEAAVREAPSTDRDGSPAAPRASRMRRDHVRLRTEMERTAADGARFRAVCSCGWRSPPVDAGRAVLVWEQHLERVMGETSS